MNETPDDTAVEAPRIGRWTRVGLALAPIAVLVLGATAFLPLAAAGGGDRLFLTSPGGAGHGAHYAPLRDLSLDRRSGYGQPSRVLGAPLDVGETPFERLGRNAGQNGDSIRNSNLGF